MIRQHLVISPQLSIAPGEIELSFARSSGPGGQNVNKVNTKAVLRWSPTTSASLPEAVRQRFLARYGSRLTADGELILAGQQYRDQGRNIDDCLNRLREMIAAVAVAPRKRKKTKPGRGAVERRLHHKRAASEKKRLRRREFD